jgi:REP element-mobilizing transposase RayT/DNA-binding transcriptional regulator YiaG
MVRGIDRMDIFLDEDDKKRFLETLKRMKEQGEYVLFAYCIMNNHVHLLIKEEKDSIQRSMKRICVSYSYYFNQKYKRIGHLFQDRFRSEAIEADTYILSCARYIHNNPVKAGITKKAEDYKWSSYKTYIGLEKDNILLLDKKLLLGMFSKDEDRAVELLKKFTNENVEDKFMDADDKTAKSKELIKEITNTKDTISNILKNHGLDFSDLKTCTDKTERNKVLKEIKDTSNVSVRELSRILGISKDIIFRA